MKVLLLGHNGQLGKSLLNKLPNRINLFIDNIYNKNIINLNNFKKIYNEIKPEIIINCIAYTKVDKAEDNIIDNKECYDVNSNFLQIIGKNISNKTLFIHISTDYVFDGNKTQPYSVDDEVNPINEYGKSKYRGEEYIRSIFKNYIIIRTSALFSSYGSNFVKSIFKLLNSNNEIQVVNDQFFVPTPAEDLAEVILEIVLNYKVNMIFSDIFHFVGNGKFLNWFEFACKIKKIAKVDTLINSESSSNSKFLAKRPPYSVLSDKLIREKYNFQSKNWEFFLDNVILEIKN